MHPGKIWKYSYKWAILHCIQKGYADIAYLYARILAHHARRAAERYETMMIRRHLERAFMATGKSLPEAMRLASSIVDAE
jgi:Na+/pantothenate symporter